MSPVGRSARMMRLKDVGAMGREPRGVVVARERRAYIYGEPSPTAASAHQPLPVDPGRITRESERGR
jgi:hypothetical protein